MRFGASGWGLNSSSMDDSGRTDAAGFTVRELIEGKRRQGRR